MADQAYTNAKSRLEALSVERKQLTERIAELEREAERASAFIRDWELWAAFGDLALRPTLFEEDMKAAPMVPKRSRPKNPPKEVVGAAIETFLRTVERPASRKRLMQVLRDDGIDLQGTDPDMVLSTMLWRMQEKFIRLPGIGYWLREVPLPSIGYDPNRWTLAEADAAAPVDFIS